MRIISNFHDYYDCIQAYGQNQNFIYVRKEETIEIDNWPFPRLQHYSNDCTHYEYMIGFCGKIYPVVVMCNGLRPLVTANNRIKPGTETKSFCYDLESINTFVEDNYKKKTIQRYYSNKGWSWFRQKTAKEYFDRCVEQQDNYEKMFRDSGHPIFVVCSWTNKYYKYKLTYNASLKEYKFFKVFPTASAYQEISMYLGGVLGKANPTIPEISNNDMIEAKGFDLKTSFRKDKSK